MAADLKAAGINRVNISLDTLDARRYSEITGKDRLDKVLKGIERTAETGLAPIKINMVPMRGINDDEIRIWRAGPSQRLMTSGILD